MEQADILVVDADVGLCTLLARDFNARGHAVRHTQSADDACELLTEHEPDLVIVDVAMDLCARVHARHEVPVVVMSAQGTLASAIAAIRDGAYDFVTKPVDLDQFALVLERALGLDAPRRERRLRATGSADTVAPHLLGRSDALARVRRLVAHVADTDSTVLITGESGTGKELVAKAIHDRSARRHGPFVAINCAAMPESLLESELFGHARGAFTDAKETRIGLFVRAGQGTIFLDEIGEMPPGMQAKLLRATQERRVRPVGSDHEVEFDARIIAATHRDLDADVHDKTFREDSFYRINVFRIHTPPLRARSDDTLLIAQQFLEHLAQRSKRDVRGWSADVAKQLIAYPWPGNVRQLQNCIERAVAVAKGSELTLEDLPDEVRDFEPSKWDFRARHCHDITAFPCMDEIEQRYIRQVLSSARGNKTLAAQILGFDRRTLYRKLDRMDELTVAATDVGSVDHA